MSKREGPEPCPNCGSRNARWRKPRPLDVPLTWGAFMIDFVLGGAGRDRATALPYGPGMPADSGTTATYGELKERFDMKVGLKVPEAFWRCPDCRKKGEVRDLASLGADIALISGMESAVSAEGGGVSDSIHGGGGRPA